MYRFTKRLLDLVVSTAILLVSFPVLIIVSMLIKLSSQGPVLYLSKRTGLYGSPFTMFKFRTMVVGADTIGGHSTAKNDSRLISCGAFLRKYKLDELPQLLNVALGNMSLVGPRPQVKFYTDLYTEQQRKILTVKPGIVDLATLYFINMDEFLGEKDVDNVYRELVEPKKNELRLKYAEEANLTLDFQILIETFFQLCRLRDVTKTNLKL